jgi:hypothetical protein
MFSHVLKRYYEPLRLPSWPSAISFPYTHQLMSLQHHHEGSPALDCLSSATCRPCYPGRSSRPIPLCLPECIGLPLTSTGSASSSLLTRLHLGSLALRPAALPSGNSRPMITQTPLPCATGGHGQFPARDFNPLDRAVVTANGRT